MTAASEKLRDVTYGNHEARELRRRVIGLLRNMRNERRVRGDWRQRQLGLQNDRPLERRQTPPEAGHQGYRGAQADKSPFWAKSRASMTSAKTTIPMASTTSAPLSTPAAGSSGRSTIMVSQWIAALKIRAILQRRRGF